MDDIWRYLTLMKEKWFKIYSLHKTIHPTFPYHYPLLKRTYLSSICVVFGIVNAVERIPALYQGSRVLFRKPWTLRTHVHSLWPRLFNIYKFYKIRNSAYFESIHLGVLAKYDIKRRDKVLQVSFFVLWPIILYFFPMIQTHVMSLSLIWITNGKVSFVCLFKIWAVA